MQFQAVRVLAGLWLALFLASFAVLFLTEPTGDGFTRGLNRLASFMTWQGIAMAPAVLAALLTYRAAGSGDPHSKRIGYAPLTISVLLIALLVAMIAYRVLVAPMFEGSLAP